MGANEKHAATYHGGEYTPSTDVVLAAYMECEKRHMRTPDEKAISAFDRWLDRVRAEAKAEALREAASIVHSEARWQWELHQRHSVAAQLVAQRMTVIEEVLTNRANQYSVGSE